MKAILLLLLSLPAWSADRPDPFAGWTPDARGGWQGTGSNFLSGYERDPRTGVMRGSGDKFGEVWVPTPGGGYRLQSPAFSGQVPAR